MKKIFLLMLIIMILIVWVTGCNNTDNVKEIDTNKTNLTVIDLDRIIEIDVGVLGDEKFLNYKNMIKDEIEFSVEQTFQMEKSIIINNSEHMLKYQDTLYYPIGSKRVHRYFANGDESKTVLMDDDGKINALMYVFATLDISEANGASEILEVLKPELSKVIDISFYENVSVPLSSSNEKKFGFYDYLFYNQINGYMTDYLKVSVRDNGDVLGLNINNFTSNDITINIDKEKEKDVIELKLKDIYDTSDTQYQSYKLYFEPYMVIYDGEVYVRYFISTQYIDLHINKTMERLNSILIPLDLISN